MILTKESIENISINELLATSIKKSEFENFLLVVPTNRKLRQQKKEIISIAPKGIATSLSLETLNTLSLKLVQQSKKIEELSDESATLFIEQSVKKTKLNYFNNYKGKIPSGTLDRIKNVISKYKEEGITPQLLKEEAEQLNRSEKLKALDIASIYENYLELCKGLNVFELGDIYQYLSGLDIVSFTEIFRKTFSKVGLVVFQGFDKFTLLEIIIINKLASIKGVKLFLVFDYSLYNSMIFSHLNETYERFQKYGFNKIEEKESVNPNAFIEIIKKELFLNKKRDINKRFEKNIVRIEAANRDEEVELIGKEIKKLLIEKKADPSDISVTFNLIGNYSPIVRDKFSALGIPFNLTDRLKLDSSLAVIAVMSFLDILNSDYYYKNIERAFSNSLLNLQGINLNATMFTSSTLKIIAGETNWIKGIERGIDLEKRKHGLHNSEKYINNYTAAANTLAVIGNYLDDFKEPTKPLVFYGLLKNLIYKLELAPNILKSNITNKEKEIKALTTLLDSTEEIFGLIEKENNEKYPLSFFVEKLSTLISSTRFNIKERSNYGVLVTNINELRGLKFKYSFIGGLVDGDFPTRYRPEIFFSGKYAKKERQHLAEERYRFYQALESWNKGLYLTLPIGDGEKRSAESTFIKDFETVFSTSRKDRKDFENLIYSEEEIQKRIPVDFIEGKNIDEKEKILLAIDNEKQRNSSPHVFSEYSGFVIEENENLFNSLNKSEAPYSISQLETYNRCPFKYFLERVLKIEVNEEPDEEIEAVIIGSLLHTILYQFYATIKKKNIKLKHCSEQVFNIAETILFEIAENYVNEQFEYSPLSFYEKEKIIGVEGKRENSILFHFLKSEQNDESNRIPEYFETNFGVEDSEQDKELSISEPLLIDDVMLRGKIDRIDVDKESNEFEVVDYKSGSMSVSKKDIEEGTSLQLPIYIWAAKELLTRNSDEPFNPVAMSIFSLKFNKEKFGKKSVSLGSKKTPQTELINEYVDIALEHVKNSIANIRKGAFPITRFTDDLNKACRYCNFRMICRIDDIVR